MKKGLGIAQCITISKKWYKTATDKFPWYTNLLRCIVVSALVYYMVPWDVFPPLNRAKEQNKTASAGDSFEPETGMGGGMSYFESLLPGISIENASLDSGNLIGVPEPEEFSKPELVLYASYTIQPKDTVKSVAEQFGLNQDTIISVNGITNARLLRINQVLRVPNQNGILYYVKTGDTLARIAKKFDIDMSSIQTANELFSDTLKVNSSLFIPGAKLDLIDLQEINGDLFIWPVRGYITSNYGYRASPFNGGRQFHSGMDIGVSLGTPVKAAMSGRVTTTGFDNSYGNYIVVSHHSGYRTLYAHLSVIRTKTGAYVETGDRIGDAGSTGLSTGPHLHFTVYKNGVTVNPRPLIK